MNSNPSAEIDRRFSDPEAGPTPWSDALDVLERANCTGSPPSGPTVGHM